MKEVLNLIVDLFPNCSFELEGTNTCKTLRINLKGYCLEADQIGALYKIHPFRIHLAGRNEISGITFGLFFDFKEDVLNDEYCDIPPNSEQLLKDFVKYLDEYGIAEIWEKHIDSFLGYRKIRNAKVQ
ncbi:hypothetical protein [Chryseobacterium arthrosphaerae]|uniref:hypothetical protein n=1 Tax=Chryseobacterium arthrosphaerae TaxID=651561 RepID=UPI00241FC5CA|nr:hypothetical protein [Chryseobacterium arthrosphaerae]